MALRNTNIAHLIQALGRGVSVVEDTEGLVLKIDLPLLTASGTNTYTITSGFTDPLTSYTDTAFLVKFTNACTGASTLNIDGVGAAALKKSGTTALASGDIAAGQIFLVVHDGTNWQMIGIGGSGGGGGTGDVVGPASAVDSNIVLFDTTSGKLIKDSGKAHSTDGTLASNSDSKIPTEKAVKTYVDGAVTGLLELKGSTDCSANPNYPAASKGDSYYVTVAGKIGGASGKSVEIGDVYVASADNVGGTEASVGTSWFVLEHNLVGALLAANNLSDVANAGTARTNLGVGTGDTPTFTGLLLSGETASRIASFDGSKNVKALDTATYPSLTELARVKGIDSAMSSVGGDEIELALVLGYLNLTR